MISITKKQAEQFNRMRASLIQIAKEYQTPAQLRRNSEKQYGLDYEDCLEMSYENIQDTAKIASKGVKAIELPRPLSGVPVIDINTPAGRKAYNKAFGFTKS